MPNELQIMCEAGAVQHLGEIDACKGQDDVSK